MDFKYSNKYFKATGLIAKIGIGVLAFGIILFIVIAAITHPVPAIFTAGWFIIGGILMLVLGSSGNMTDAEYDEQSVKATARIVDKVMNKFEVEDRHVKMFDPIILSGYEYKDEEDFMFKKGNDGKYRSNHHITAVMLFGPQQMYLYIYKLNLTDENNPDSEIMAKYKYLDLKDVAIVEKKLNVKIKEKVAEIDYSMFEMKTNDGKIIVSAPSQNDAIIDGKMSDINKYIQKVKKQAEAQQ
jgi:hypothetical protein